MGLTSKKLLVLVTVLAVVMFAATIWLWPRLSRRGVKPIAGRVGLLLGGQLSILAALGLAINSYFGFYASFADLFGTQQDPGAVIDYSSGGGPTNKGLQQIATQPVGVPGGGLPQRAGRAVDLQPLRHRHVGDGQRLLRRAAVVDRDHLELVGPVLQRHRAQRLGGDGVDGHRPRRPYRNSATGGQGTGRRRVRR